MVKGLVIPEDVMIALAAYPHVRENWESSSDEHKHAWLTYVEESNSPAHRERRIDIMIAGLKS